jgi:hypothetical protein
MVDEAARQQQEQQGADADADADYCARRFKSYNPETGMYRGRDGRLHPCP